MHTHIPNTQTYHTRANTTTDIHHWITVTETCVQNTSTNTHYYTESCTHARMHQFTDTTLLTFIATHIITKATQHKLTFVSNSQQYHKMKKQI